MNTNRTILLTNDDGISAKGLSALAEMLRPYGAITVVAPQEPQSGMSNAVTITAPIRLTLCETEEGVTRYVCTGTPTDCVKIAMSQLFADKKPDLLVSGINHGANTSSAVLYSGTLGAAAEGVLYGIPSIGFSLATPHCPDADFSGCIHFGRIITEQYLLHPAAPNVYLNVNVPDIPMGHIKGIRWARQGKGSWIKEFDKRIDSGGQACFWLTGEYRNDEPDAPDTDHNLIRQGYITITPHQVDTTHYGELERLRQCWHLA